MQRMQLDRWTKEAVRTALRVLRSSDDRFREDPTLLADLSQRVREVISRGVPQLLREGQSAGSLGEELAVAVYLTVAANGSDIALTPQLLATLNEAQVRILEELEAADAQEEARGGAQMKKAITITLALVFAFMAAPEQASAAPEFAKQWQSSCGSCHVGPPTELDEEGIAFRLAGYGQEVDPKIRRPKLFFSFITEALSFTEDNSMEAPESAQLFTLVRLDRADKVKIFAIGELTEEQDDMGLDFAHGHLQVNPLETPERLNLRLGNVEPMTRLWNSDMRRVTESSMWAGVDTGTGAVTAVSGGHAHGHGDSGGRPAILPASDWGGDISSVIGRNLLVSGGVAGDNAYAGVFWKRGGRAFDNSTVAPGFAYGDLSEQQQAAFNKQQTNLARKWERSVIFGLSAYVGTSAPDVFDGAFLSPLEMEHDEHDEPTEAEPHGDEHGEGEGDEHGDEGDEHGDAGEPHEAFLPTRVEGTSRLVGEIKTRWDRFGVYLVGVYGENDYDRADPEHWEEHGEFEFIGRESTDFFAWAAEGSARFSVSRKLTGRVALRYEELTPEDELAERFRRGVANLTIPIRLMRPALWPYVEASRDLNLNDWEVRGGLKIAY